ncbi:MAG: CotH kinase family protein [Candidatus Marinimicrobia bacterium]|nr:CotH kinase family protein [Candidatus Neomarinimicrobiota bacterium]
MFKIRTKGLKLLTSLLVVSVILPQDHWETAVYAADEWAYQIPESELSSDWNTIGFDDSDWSTGPGGFGYGDEDDGTEIEPALSVYLRRIFAVTNTVDLISVILHADYDDGFVAYLNGTEIGRSNNLGESGTFVPYDETTSTDHEAQLYSGGYPEAYTLDSLQLASLLTAGENVLAIQVHNVGITSSDMSSNFYLSFGIADESTYYGPPPDWFEPPFVFNESNLPIVVIETNGQEILDDPRIIAHMGIIDNGTGINHINDPLNGYDGQISIEIRGSSSQMFPKKQYALETQDIDGENLNVSILGMPEENDWILHAPYSDKSLLRNFLAYELARDMGRYASRTRFCELVINGDYKGLYIFMEKIKRDNNRVDISKLEPDETSGDDLTGGYIIKVDKWDGENNDGWLSDPPLPENYGTWYQYHYPKPDEIVQEQQNYIIDYITDFENLIASESYNEPDSGYYNFVNLESFIDVSIINEISKNVDAYRLSAYMYKDKDSEDGRLTMGPIWDYNLAFGNADYFEGQDNTGWVLDINLPSEDPFWIPFWWYRIWDDETFRNAFNQRWQELRQTVFSEEYIMNMIDSTIAVIDEAQVRNFQRWPILEEYVWPNAYVGGSYENEIDYLTDWITARLNWMDEQTMSADDDPQIILSYRLEPAYPNPFNPTTTIQFTIPQTEFVTVKVYNIVGHEITTLINDKLFTGNYSIKWNGRHQPSGLYFVQIESGSFSKTRKMVLIK